MKDDKEHIDQLFESLNDRQFDIPEAFLEDLNKRLDNNGPKKNRKHFFLWFIIPLVLIGMIGIVYSHYSDKSEVNKPVEQTNKLIAQDEYNPHLKERNEHLVSEQNQNTQSATDSISILPVAKDLSKASQTSLEKRQSKTLKKANKQKKPFDHLSAPSLKTKNTPTKQVSGKLKTKNKKSHTKLHSNNQSKKVKSKKKGTLQNSFASKKSKINAEENNKLNPGNNESIPDEITKQASKPDAAGNITSTPKPGKEELAKEAAVPAAEKDSTGTENAIDTVQQVDSNQPEKDEATPPPPTKKWKKEIGLFAGLGGNLMHDSPKNSEYLAKIKQNQTSILAPSFGVNANLSYKKFTFGSGIHYEQTGEKFKANIKGNVLKDSTYSEFIQDTVWVQDSTGGWFPTIHDTTIYHTVQYTESASLSQSFQNRYSWISIPLHFGYRFELGDYELIPRIGAVFNFGIAGSGIYPNDSFTNIRQYRPVKFTVSYLIQFEARRNFDKWFVFVNPYFRSMINPSVSGDVIRRRYTSWGMQFGVGLKL